MLEQGIDETAAIGVRGVALGTADALPLDTGLAVDVGRVVELQVLDQSDGVLQVFGTTGLCEGRRGRRQGDEQERGHERSHGNLRREIGIAGYDGNALRRHIRKARYSGQRGRNKPSGWNLTYEEAARVLSPKANWSAEKRPGPASKSRMATHRYTLANS